ncbi:cadmium transporter [Bifidobacterium sp. BRDM6]|uniref:Cadmium transporter n=1 Tax=Bifidobacterium choloepi TaxID=2614131 RepID=A0A6I5NG28_9BIFI|nr:cadmium transporter [Bifidobacterium choloepi]
MPLMGVQAVLVAAVLCLGELICSPIYVSMSGGAFYLGSWWLLACLLAVAFSYIVGFALLWCCESFAYRMKRKVQPLVYAVVGAVGFGVWTTWVVLSIMGSILSSAGLAVASGSTVPAAVNGAVLGLAAFFCAATLGERLAHHRVAVAIVLAVTILLAIAGAVVLFRL